MSELFLYGYFNIEENFTTLKLNIVGQLSSLRDLPCITTCIFNYGDNSHKIYL